MSTTLSHPKIENETLRIKKLQHKRKARFQHILGWQKGTPPTSILAIGLGSDLSVLDAQRLTSTLFDLFIWLLVKTVIYKAVPLRWTIAFKQIKSNMHDGLCWKCMWTFTHCWVQMGHLFPGTTGNSDSELPLSGSVHYLLIFIYLLSLQLCLSNSRYGMSCRDLSMISSSISC